MREGGREGKREGEREGGRGRREGIEEESWQRRRRSMAEGRMKGFRNEKYLVRGRH